MNRLTIVTRSMYGGGAERVISELLKGFDSQGICCQLIMIDNEDDFYYIPPKVKVVKIGRKHKNEIFDRIARYSTMRKEIVSFNPEIVLSLPEDIGIYVIPFMINSKIPIVVSERNNPWVMPYSKISRALRKMFYPRAKGIIFQTSEAASFFSKKIQKKGIILPNPLDISKLCTPYEGKRKKIIVSAGRLDYQKNFELLIKAFSIFHKDHLEFKLIIFGEGKLRSKLESLCKELNIDNYVDLPGKENELLKRIVDCSMFILSSNYEGAPNALIEAMSIGLPSISTDCPSGGPRSIINNEENGLLVPVGDVETLAASMSKIADNEKYSAMISHNAIKIAKKYDSNIVVGKWISYLSMIVRSTKK